MKEHISTIVLTLILLILSAASLFVGVIDLSPASLLSGSLHQLEVFLISRLPRLLAILCTGAGMSAAGLHEMTQALSSWLVGHFSMVLKGRYEIVWLVVPLIVIAFLFANHFNIVGMGKEFSQNLGVPYNVVLFTGLTIAAMITASVVVVVGSISYIGLIVPNIVSMFKGDKIRGTLADTMLFGAVFVLICDLAGRLIIAPYELPIELIIGVVGSVLFVLLLLYRLRYGRKAVRLSLPAALRKGGISGYDCQKS